MSLAVGLDGRQTELLETGQRASVDQQLLGRATTVGAHCGRLSPDQLGAASPQPPPAFQTGIRGIPFLVAVPSLQREDAEPVAHDEIHRYRPASSAGPMGRARGLRRRGSPRPDPELGSRIRQAWSWSATVYTARSSPFIVDRIAEELDLQGQVVIRHLGMHRSVIEVGDDRRVAQRIAIGPIGQRRPVSRGGHAPARPIRGSLRNARCRLPPSAT